MGELIAFRLPKDGARSTSTPVQAGMVLLFTGVRRERMIDPSAKSKRLRRGGDKRTDKSRDKSARPIA
ncbi:hypothetical protein RZS28_05745 [Methylocapsa polymorpha]|uniref:Uncharacterized protein n=1 Tax=Methylocapsa polymorpha TaxID=3080828 RepID=A0ABZ0HU39_9HYPH|nr:hypothetical protein RZS28_05745 [Methylocapsa sp. RX1]